MYLKKTNPRCGTRVDLTTGDNEFWTAVPEKNTLPSLSDVVEECQFQHELDHLCRPHDPRLCTIEPPALDVTSGCYDKYIRRHCTNVKQDGSPRDALCKQMCGGSAWYEGVSNYANCFCNIGSAAANGIDACCACVPNCSSRPTFPSQCEPYRANVTSMLEQQCPRFLKGSESHSCAYYGQWRSPWDTRVLSCEDTPSPSPSPSPTATR
ncbi:MAG: hypothetical protein KDD69_08600 [Bdellovibrionales bacterium]|nr:hypothetical protein [Bdellovibrionales bacterium]